MDKLGKLSSSVSKKLASKKTGAHNNSGGQGLREVVKDATAKSLRFPDPDLNQQVADLIGSALHTEGPQEVARILTERLTLKNPHKVWLAIELIREVLRKCETELNPVRDDIMFEVGKVASGAMNRFNSNLADQQRAKSAAFDLLKTYGKDGHILSQPHLQHDRRTSPATPPPHGGMHSPSATPRRAEGRHGMSWPELKDAVETQIAMASSHNDLLQDMLLDTSSFESRTPEQRGLAKDVILEATQFRQSFEQLLAQLSAFDSAEANALMTTALEKMDILNNSLQLHKESLKKQLSHQHNRSPHKGPGGNHSGHHSNPSSHAPAQTPPQTGSILDLEQGFDAPGQPQQAVHDPFAASTQQWHQGPAQPAPGNQPQASHSSNPFSDQAPAWHGGRPPMMQGYPGYGYSAGAPGYGYGYGPYPGPAPPTGNAQGTENHSQRQPYPPTPGYGYGPYAPYGHYPPPGPYQHPPGPPPQQPHDRQWPAMQPASGHVPAPMTQALVYVNDGPSPAHQPSSGPAGTEPAPKADAKAAFQPSRSGEHQQLAPSTPPVAQANPSTAAGTSHQRASAPDKPSKGSFSDAPDSKSPAVLAGYQPAAQSETKRPPSADDWDIFFTERVGAGGKGEPERAGRPGPSQSAGVDGLTDAFQELAAGRKSQA